MPKVERPTYSPGVLRIYFYLLELVLFKVHEGVEEEGDCWMWRGALDSGSPVLAMPHRRFGYGSEHKPPGQIRLRTLLMELMTGKRPPAEAKTQRYVVSAKCGNGACVCPDCASYMRHGEPIKRGFANQDAGTALMRRKNVAAHKKANRVLTDEQVRRIRTELNTSGRALAREFGRNLSVIQECRLGKTYVFFSAPSPLPSVGMAQFGKRD